MAAREPAQAPAQPSGTVSFLFSDIEGSTRLLQRVGASIYGDVLARHCELLRSAFADGEGYEVDCEGDSFFVAFATARQALAAAQRAQQLLRDEPWPAGVDLRVRMGVHTGEAIAAGSKYVGVEIHRAARIMAAAHGGQVVVSSTTHDLASGFPLHDLGGHRLRDFPGPQRLYQLGDGSFPPLRTLSTTNLPHPTSSFVGRHRELREVLARLTDGARLLSLTGPGGAGKTRLALEVATALVGDYAAGAYWVDLAAVRDPALVTETIARVIGARSNLAEHIESSEMLLVLDNVEQVIESAPELAALVRACSNLSVLVTSREMLRVEGEVVYVVPPLAASEAQSLFCERASIAPGREVQEICERLDNLPLAIELAAARTRALSPAQIAERLPSRLDLLHAGRGAHPRHATLRATIAWSYDLLTEPERRLLRHLSVFAGGCSLEAAEQICGAELDQLQSLVEKSLVRFADERYSLLETIRVFAAEELAREGARPIRRAHMAWFARELAARELRIRNDDDEALRFAAAELDNAGVALRSALELRSAGDVAQLIWGTYKAWPTFGRAREGTDWANAVLDAELIVEGPLRVCLLIAVAELLRAAAGQDSSRVRRLYEEALVAASACDGDAVLPGGRRVATLAIGVRGSLSDIAQRDGDIAAARAYAEGALERARELRDPAALARALDAVSTAALVSGDFAAAVARAAEKVAIDTGLGRVGDASDSLTLIAHCELERGNEAAAAAALSDAAGRLRGYLTRWAYVTNVFLAAAALALARGERGVASAFTRLSVKTTDDLAMALDAERMPILARLREALADDQPSIDFASEDDALERASELARDVAWSHP